MPSAGADGQCLKRAGRYLRRNSNWRSQFGWANFEHVLFYRTSKELADRLGATRMKVPASYFVSAALLEIK